MGDGGSTMCTEGLAQATLTAAQPAVRDCSLLLAQPLRCTQVAAAVSRLQIRTCARLLGPCGLAPAGRAAAAQSRGDAVLRRPGVAGYWVQRQEAQSKWGGRRQGPGLGRQG